MTEPIPRPSSTIASRDERGATATEYGILVGFLALAITVGVTAFGNAVNQFIADLAAQVALF